MALTHAPVIQGTHPAVRRCARALFALGLLGAAGSASLTAQRPLHTVRGVVRDTSERPLAGAEVVHADGKRRATTGADGRFALDSIAQGTLSLMVRLVGYFPGRATVEVPQTPGDSLEILLYSRPQLLPTVVVESERPGIRGVVGDTGYHAIPGALVTLIRSHQTAVTDSMGRFAFTDLKPGAYVLSVSHPWFRGRMISLLVSQRGGREYSIFLDRRGKSGRDWTDSRALQVALADLDARLAWGIERNRMTSEELKRYGSAQLCDVPRLRVRGHPTPMILVDGQDRMTEGASLCAWNADEVELVEFGDDACKDDSKTLAEILKLWCGGRRTASFGYSSPRQAQPGYVVIWLRR
jgi:Carboxypeptidase regulatory-like domain